MVADDQTKCPSLVDVAVSVNRQRSSNVTGPPEAETEHHAPDASKSRKTVTELGLAESVTTLGPKVSREDPEGSRQTSEMILRRAQASGGVPGNEPGCCQATRVMKRQKRFSSTLDISVPRGPGPAPTRKACVLCGLIKAIPTMAEMRRCRAAGERD